MAIKASCTVTLSCYRDTQSVTRYYKLQSSTASAPSKPTTKPPSGWSDSEPSYTSGSTNTLYFCDLTVFSDGTWSYSTVSKSSSYEAAKEAYNKAQNAQNAAKGAQNSINSLEIGGRNLLLDSAFPVGTNKWSRNTVDTTVKYMNNNSMRIRLSGNNRLDVPGQYFASYITGKQLFLTFYIMCPDVSKLTTTVNCWIGFRKTGYSANGGIPRNISPSELTDNVWKKITITGSNSDPSNIYCTMMIEPHNPDVDIYIACPKLEYGSKGSDWTPAPEDMASEEQVIDVNQKTEDIKSEVNSYKERLAEINVITEEIQNCISMLVTDTNGNSLMTQTEDGWTFNIDKINKSVNDISKGLDNLQNELGSTSNTINELSKAVADVSKISAYVKIRLEGNKPCIELGTGDNNFKLLITNTDIRFMEGSSVPAYINNKSLYIKKAIVEEELKQGSFTWVIHGSGNLGLMWK